MSWNNSFFKSKSESKRFALVIGNKSYEFFDALPNAQNDADCVSEKLGSFGFSVTSENNLAQKEMRDTIIEFTEKWPRENLKDVVFYFAGHGCSTGM